MTDSLPERPADGADHGGVLVMKLALPLPRWPPVPRERLLELLDGGTQGPLTLVAAQPGAGKTVLLASWVAAGRAPGPVAWVTVDPGDQDPTRLWSHVLAALRGTGALPAGGLLAGLDAPPDIDQRFLASLVNGLAELEGPVVLVLDDLHEAGGLAVMAGLQFLLRHAPAQLRLVLATRADPLLSLHRFRVAGQLTELRAADLAFTPPEAQALLAGLGVGLAEAELQSLWLRTEGWAAGLRLAALSLQGHPDPERFVADFAGQDRAVAGYLIEEALARQPPEGQEFLLRTCVVDRLCGSLADALTGRSDGELALAGLERDHVFTSGLGPNRSWYRYHPLFAELLRAELAHRRPREVPELHRRAAAWHGANGLVGEAVRHALAGGDPEGAAGLVRAHWVALLVDGRAESLRELLGRLPADRVRGDPELAAVAAVSRLALGELEEADTWLRPFAPGDPETQRPPAPAGDLARLLRSRLELDVEGAAAAAAGLLVRAGNGEQPGREGELRALVLGILGAAELWGGRLDVAAAHLEESRVLAVRGGRGYLRLGASAHLALLEAASGRLSRAEQTGRAAVQLARRGGWSTGPEAACAELALALVAYHRNDPAGGTEPPQAARLRPALAAAAVLEARAGLERGDPAAALEALAPHLGDGLADSCLPVLLEACLLDAVARRRLTDHAGAAESLERALELAAPEGFRRVFVDGGGPVRALLADHLHRNTPRRAFAETVLEGLMRPVTTPSTGATSLPPGVPQPVEPLSERERVVLRYLPSMLSAGEIADELYVSVNTVKTHIKSIYRKLDTNRRWDAVRRARQLQLL